MEKDTLMLWSLFWRCDIKDGFGQKSLSGIRKVTTRQRLNFRVGVVDGIHPKYMILLQRNDGYEYFYSRRDIAVNN